MSVGQTSFPKYKELFWCGRQVLATLRLPELPVSLENTAPQWSTAHGNLGCDKQACGNHAQVFLGLASSIRGRIPAVGGGEGTEVTIGFLHQKEEGWKDHPPKTMIKRNSQIRYVQESWQASLWLRGYSWGLRLIWGYAKMHLNLSRGWGSFSLWGCWGGRQMTLAYLPSRTYPLSL